MRSVRLDLRKKIERGVWLYISGYGKEEESDGEFNVGRRKKMRSVSHG